MPLPTALRRTAIPPASRVTCRANYVGLSPWPSLHSNACRYATTAMAVSAVSAFAGAAHDASVVVTGLHARHSTLLRRGQPRNYSAVAADAARTDRRRGSDWQPPASTYRAANAGLAPNAAVFSRLYLLFSATRHSPPTLLCHLYLLPPATPLFTCLSSYRRNMCAVMPFSSRVRRSSIKRGKCDKIVVRHRMLIVDSNATR